MNEFNERAKKIADGADMIINGYAFTKAADLVRIININNLKNACVINSNDEIIETTMSDIEMQIVLDFYKKDKKYMECGETKIA